MTAAADAARLGLAVLIEEAGRPSDLWNHPN
jgi:hypothetical protein